MKSAIEVMRERHSVKKYIPQPIPQEDLNEILELAGTAPSSLNLQHWRFLVIQKDENKQRLLPIAFNQPQIVECSAVIAVLGDTQTNLIANKVYDPQLEAGTLPQENYDKLMGMIQHYSSNKEKAVKDAVLNASLAAMQLMLAAKAKGYDTCPIGGFIPEKLVEEFKIPERFTPVMLIALGTVREHSKYVNSRLPLEEIVIHEGF